VEIETVSEELDSSDQKSFQRAGVPAVQLFAGPHPDYHRPTDTIDKIDPDGLQKIASVAKEALQYLADREGPLSSNLQEDPGETILLEKSSRRVSLGTVPDYVFQGEGYRLSGVVPGSPADSAGLREGDIIVRIAGDVIRSLRDVSNSLKSLKPGDRIVITFLRKEKEMTAEADVVAR
jgi:predicted metalloprotease with PDZ domain